MKEYYCACTKTKCEGICRKLHLFRKRKSYELDGKAQCVAAYVKEK